MNIPRVARYDYVLKKSCEFILSENFKIFPINPFNIINKKKWGLITYTELSQINCITTDSVCKAFKTEHSYSIYDGIYVIAYNNGKSVGRTLFNLLHEIGHIVLNHFVDFKDTILLDFNEVILRNNSLTEGKYKILENEANCFARNALSPIVLVNYLNLSESNIVNAFNVTDAAATTRLDFKRRDLYWITSHDYKLLLEHFKPFIYKATHAYHCSNCQTVFVAENANYCPICSNRAKKIKLHIRSDFDMIYPGYKVAEKGQLMQCIRCQNEEIEESAYYCKICGASVVNECSNQNCRQSSDSNARYCISCGCDTTFYEQGLLPAWNVDDPAQEESAVAINNDFLGPL